MATNSFFSNYTYSNEQELIDSLVIESIRIHGVDTFYLSRSVNNIDKIMNEDKVSIFNRAHQFEVYIKTFDGFQGEGDFLSKFGLQIRDQMTVAIARRTFERFATRNQPNLIRPFEGDLIYFPMNKKFFKIMHVEHEAVFYQAGSLQTYEVKCELFEYSNERFETGFEFIDNQFDRYKTDKLHSLEDLEAVDILGRNFEYEKKANEFLDFSEINPFEEEISIPTDHGITADDRTGLTTDNIIITGDDEPLNPPD